MSSTPHTYTMEEMDLACTQPQGNACVQTDPGHDAPESPSANGRKDETSQPAA